MALALFLLEVDAANSLDRQRVFRDRLYPLEAYNNTEFISRYRITKHGVPKIDFSLILYAMPKFGVNRSFMTRTANSSSYQNLFLHF